MKQADLVPYIGSRPKVSEVLNGKRNLSLSMIRKLHTHLGIPAEILISDGRVFPSDGEAIVWDSFPVMEIVNRGWVTGFDPRTQAEEIMRRLASLACADSYFSEQNHVCMRQGSRRNTEDDPNSIDAWVLGVLAHAERIDIKTKFDPDILDKSFISKVANLSVLSDGPLKAREFLLNKGIKLVTVRHFNRTHLEGAAMINKKGEAIIALTLRHDRLDNFWFTLAHELAHLVLGHVADAVTQCIIDDLDIRNHSNAEEDEADKLATESLIPQSLWESHPARNAAKLNVILDLAQKADVSISVVAGRIRYEKNNYGILDQWVGRGKVRKLFFE